jgi:GH24 family phage-related lysozyme (muramidase)
MSYIKQMYGSLPYINTSINDPSLGSMRCVQGEVQIWNGNYWHTTKIGMTETDLSDEAKMLLDWVREKQSEEINLRHRMAQNPGLKSAYEQFKIMDELTRQEDYRFGQEA